MKKVLLLVLMYSLASFYATAQSKVFKEVSEEISSQVRTIRQDNALVGYLVFTKLEKASEDSFNYRITIMDENLNDIGVVNFREQNISLHDVSFEQDILCLAYLRENIIGKEFKKKKELADAMASYTASVFLQFLGLDGKILHTTSIPAELNVSRNYYSKRPTTVGGLKEGIQLKNIPQYGFACFYGDLKVKKLMTFKANGELLWNKDIKEVSEFSVLLTSREGIYLLIKKKDAMQEGGFEMLSYKAQDGTEFPKYKLKDKKGNSLKVLSFNNDPVTGNPFVSGNIIDSKNGNWYGTAKQLFKGPYAGVFTINFNGYGGNDVQAVYSYWNDGSQSFVNNKGYYIEQKAYAELTHAFRDYQGNTYFAGPSVYKKLRWEPLAAAPLVLPLFIFAMDPDKAKVGDPFLIKQDTKGILSFDNSVPTAKGKRAMVASVYTVSSLNTKSFYPLANPIAKVNYLIVDDEKNISIYNVNDKKVSRTIPSKEGNASYYIFPAKEGHFMITEYNKKEKYTRVSIESL